MRGNIVQVQYSDLEYAVVRTEAEVGYSQNGGQLKANILQPVIKQEKQFKDKKDVITEKKFNPFSRKQEKLGFLKDLLVLISNICHVKN